MSSSLLPPGPSEQPSAFEVALLAVDKWFNTSPYAVYVPYVFGAVALFFRFRSSAREMAGPAPTGDEVRPCPWPSSGLVSSLAAGRTQADSPYVVLVVCPVLPGRRCRAHPDGRPSSVRVRDASSPDGRRLQQQQSQRQRPAPQGEMTGPVLPDETRSVQPNPARRAAARAAPRTRLTAAWPGRLPPPSQPARARRRRTCRPASRGPDVLPRLPLNDLMDAVPPAREDSRTRAPGVRLVRLGPLALALTAHRPPGSHARVVGEENMVSSGQQPDRATRGQRGGGTSAGGR